MNSQKSLQETLKYKNDRLVRMFAKKKGVSQEESFAIFDELKKWLWFLAQRKIDDDPFLIFPEQYILDEYWHEFILSTKDYHQFCNEFFGRYIHHVPTPDGVEDGTGYGVNISLFSEDKERYFAEKSYFLRKAMDEVAAVLGVETVRLWYQEYPKRFFFNSRTLQIGEKNEN